jgi:ribosomal protein L32
VSHFDPSWCARINAHRHTGSAPAPADREPETPPRASPSSDRAPEPRTASIEPQFRKREIPSVHVCEMCGTVMYDHHCKIVCPNCGYKRDCSDP